MIGVISMPLNGLKVPVRFTMIDIVIIIIINFNGFHQIENRQLVHEAKEANETIQEKFQKENGQVIQKNNTTTETGTRENFWERQNLLFNRENSNNSGEFLIVMSFSLIVSFYLDVIITMLILCEYWTLFSRGKQVKTRNLIYTSVYNQIYASSR